MMPDTGVTPVAYQEVLEGPEFLKMQNLIGFGLFPNLRNFSNFFFALKFLEFFLKVH